MPRTTSFTLFFAAPLTGWLFSSAAGFRRCISASCPFRSCCRRQGAGDILKVVHHFTNYALAALVVLHAAAAIKHHVVDGDDVLARMLPFLKTRN